MKNLFVLLGLLFIVSGCNNEVTVDEVVEDQQQEETYTPKFDGSARISVETSGDYTLKFNVNNKGTIYYVIQPWYEVTEYDVTASDVEAGIGQEFTILTPDGEIEENPVYVVSAKSIDVIDYEKEIIATGYMGDITGSRPPEDSEIQFSVVIWYVFKDIDGNYSNVLALSKN
jgi:hypothetical protein